MKVTIVQYCGSDDREGNIAKASNLVREAASIDSPDLIVLPEMSAYTSIAPEQLIDNAEPTDGPFVKAMRDLAVDLKINIHLGSIIELDDGKRYNTSVAFDRSGKEIAKYRKIHLFDAVFPNGVEAKESATVERGTQVVVEQIDDIPVGFSICYDLRFPELYRRLADLGAKLIVLPSAFLHSTGTDHWETLVRARAIETQCYVVAPNQVGSPSGGPAAFGHSMIVDPWGIVIAQMSNEEGFVSARLDASYVDVVRRRIPVHSHRVL